MNFWFTTPFPQRSKIPAREAGANRGFETALVPSGRWLQVTVIMTASSGYNDDYADNLSLVLTSPHALFLPLARR